ncbi:F-box/FBD/LRR-repeat protein At1g13570-like isoform X2 [Rhododendron vialii]|nr:F-box/FBD/LRR-repeat protein At1g13570-like isoform X2 [Rhododendron vialii]
MLCNVKKRVPQGLEQTMSNSTSDIISNLPCNVLEKILMCLTIQDAARTSVLSRKWRYNWTKLPHLIFNDEYCRGSRGVAMNKHIMTILGVLLLHQGPILKFTLSLAAVESCPELDLVVSFVLNNGIQEFTLHIQNGGPYRLPSTLFLCLQIEHLDLVSCVYKPPLAFKGFTRLLSLVFNEVVIPGDVLSSLISSCPLLERLTVISSTIVDYLQIVAPNLRFLHCEGLFRSISVQNSCHLAEVSVFLKRLRNWSAFNEGEPLYSNMLPESIPAIELLELDPYNIKFMAVGGVPKSLPTTLACLKVLKLYDICFGDVSLVSNILCLIRSSPNMEKLEVWAWPEGNALVDPFLELMEVEGRSDTTLNQLREVNMHSVSGKSELLFLKFILAKWRMLETLIVVGSLGDVYFGFGLLKELTRFRSLSPQAEIIFVIPGVAV